jgi:hypothetical protein
VLGPVRWPCRSSVNAFGGDAVAAGARARTTNARTIEQTLRLMVPPPYGEENV